MKEPPTKINLRECKAKSAPVLSREAGFTLIEIIATLLLVGLLGTIGTIGLSSFVQSYALSQQATDIAAKAQLATQRITKEIVAITSVSSASPTSVTFTSIHKDGNHTYTLALSGTNLMLTEGGSSDILVDGVTSFGLKYFEWNNYPASGQPNLQETTSSPYWRGPSTCTSPFGLTIVYKPTCDYQTNSPGARQELSVVFQDSTSQVLNVKYGGEIYTICEAGRDYTIRGNTSTNAACPSLKVVRDLYSSSTDDIYYYDTAYVFKKNNPECFSPVFVRNGKSDINNYDDCKIGPPVAYPEPFPSSAGSKLIQVSLTLSGSSESFIVEAAPRNIPSI